MSLFIRNAILDDELTNVQCADGVIAGIGVGLRAAPGDDIVDASGLHITPGMVNGHGHAAMVLLRGYGDDMALQPWLHERIWPAEARMTADDILWGARLACLEMIRSGTTSMWDMYWHPASTARAATELGMRATLGAVVFDGCDPDASADACAAAAAQLDEIQSFGGLIGASVAAHSVYMVSRQSLEWSRDECQHREIPLQIHCSETEVEVTDCVTATGMTPAAYLDDIGALCGSTLLAHGTFLTDHEIESIARAGATVITNPVSNMKLAVGRAAPVARMMGAGVALGLGTDGASSNNSLDMFADMKAMATLAKHATGDPAVLGAIDALAIARGQRSSLLAGRAIAVGAPADFVLVDLSTPELCIGDVSAALVYAANGHCVDTTVIAGRVAMRHRHIPDADEIVSEASARARSLTGARR